jgi:hypothetical protein
LVLLILFVLNASLVVPHSFDHQALLVLCKALCRYRTIRKEETDKNGPTACEKTEDQEQKLPTLNRSVCEVGDTEG